MTTYRVETFLPNNPTEPQVLLTIDFSDWRKGDSVGSYYGPTPDDPAEALLEEVWLKGKYQDVLLPDTHRFYAAFNEEDLFSLVEEQRQGEEADYYDTYCSDR